MNGWFWAGISVAVFFAACGAALARMAANAPLLDDEPVPYWPAEVLDDLAATVMCKACFGCADHAHVTACTCAGDCGAEGCQGRKLPLRQTSATWNDDDMDILDGKRLP